MRGWLATIITIYFLAVTWLFMFLVEANGAYPVPCCKGEVPKQSHITNMLRQIEDDFHRLDLNKHTQIRDGHRIIGHIEVDGSIINIYC